MKTPHPSLANGIEDGTPCSPMTTLEGRQRKAWWTVNNHEAVKVVGYSCAPNNPESWWCPQVGYTLHEKHHLFETEREAIEKALAEIDAMKVSLSNSRDKLVQQLKGSAIVRSGK